MITSRMRQPGSFITDLKGESLDALVRGLAARAGPELMPEGYQIMNHASRVLVVAGSIFLTLPVNGLEAVAAQTDRPAWAAAMANVHARFHGRPGTFAQFGAAITESLAFWTPLKSVRNNAPPEMEQAFRRV